MGRLKPPWGYVQSWAAHRYSDANQFISAPFLCSALLFLSSANQCLSIPFLRQSAPFYSIASLVDSYTLLCISNPSHLLSLHFRSCSPRYCSIPLQIRAFHLVSIPSQVSSIPSLFNSAPCITAPWQVSSALFRCIAEETVLLHDFLPCERPFSRISPLTEPVKASIVEPFTHKWFVTVLKHQNVELELCSLSQGIGICKRYSFPLCGIRSKWTLAVSNSSVIFKRDCSTFLLVHIGENKDSKVNLLLVSLRLRAMCPFNRSKGTARTFEESLNLIVSCDWCSVLELVEYRFSFLHNFIYAQHFNLFLAAKCVRRI